MRYLEQAEVVGHISVMKTKQHSAGLFSPDDFHFDADHMQVTCPQGKTSSSFRDRRKDKTPGYEFRFTKTMCQDCPLRAQCTTSKSVRNVFISEYYFELQRAKEHYKTEEYKEARKKRWLIERRHADKVRNHGLRRSRYRGLDRTYIHSLLSTMASNIKRMSKLITEKRKQDKSALLTAS